MKVLLVNPATKPLLRDVYVPVGLLAISQYLSNEGHETILFDHIVSKKKISAIIDKHKPSVVGVSVSSFLAFEDAVYLSKIAKQKDISVVWGGHVPTINPEASLRTGCVDFVVIGEGEKTFARILNAMQGKSDVTQINGLAYALKDKIIVNQNRTEEAMTDYPALDWEKVDVRKYLHPMYTGKRTIRTYLSKGCPFSCAFCSNSGKAIRKSCVTRSPETVSEEISGLVKDHNVDGVYFTDEFFGCGNSSLITRFCRELKDRGLNITWGCQTRIDRISEELISGMYDSGCRWIFFGIETASRRVAKQINKTIDLTKAKKIIEHCAKLGIITIGSFIIGLPDETEQDLMKTVDFALNSAQMILNVNLFTPLPDSELYDELVKQGRIQDNGYNGEYSNIQIGLEQIANFSKISKTDLLVVQNSLTLWSLLKKKESMESGGKTIIFSLKNQFSLLKTYAKTGNLSDLFALLKGHISIVWYALAYPKVKKKYGIRVFRRR